MYGASTCSIADSMASASAVVTTSSVFADPARRLHSGSRFGSVSASQLCGLESLVHDLGPQQPAGLGAFRGRRHVVPESLGDRVPPALPPVGPARRRTVVDQ